MSARGVFVTGTDTGIGKTHASVALLCAHRAHGRRASGMKPVASGCRATPAGLRNEDAEALIAASDPAPAYALCNPFAFEPPIAPHIAAREAGIEVSFRPIGDAFREIASRTDRVVVEGVGGWCVPLSDALMQADLVRALGLPVVLVVGLRLGCINHTLLTARAIEADGCALAGWIANRIDPAMAFADENLATLRARLAMPLLGEFAFGVDANDPGALIDAVSLL
ncbi:MAG TPA: dethiobiotin synthase [Rhodanobacteraceae bacterium]|nr:dethiobiotin synthase [Rhodanobacteraceae bacterium]